MSHVTVPGGLDLASVLEASRMISGQVTLERLLSKLMDIVIESSGAQRCLLVLVREGRLVIEAEGAVDRAEALVQQSILVEPDGRALLPAAIIYHVARTRESIILDDCTRIASFASDPYVTENQPQSVLCLPFIVQGQLVGILYLEHELSPGVFSPDRVQVVQLLSAQAAISIEHVRLLEDAQRRVREVETLYQAGTVMAATLQQEEAIERILEQLARVVPYDSATVQLLREGYLEIVGGRGWADSTAVVGMRFPVPGDNPNTVVLQERQPYILDDAPALYPTFREGTSSHIRSWLGVPLIIHDQGIGMLAVDSAQPGYFNADHARLATVFAAQVAVALQNARLYKEARQRMAEVETLRRTSVQLTSSLDLSAVLQSIAEGALALVGATDCLIYLYDKASESFSFGTALGGWAERGSVLAPRDSGLTAAIVQQGRPVVIDDATGHALYATSEAQEWKIQAIAGFPLQRAGQVLGVFHVAFVEPHTFLEEELRVLGLLADQAAIAIDNARLFEAERAQLEELTVLHAVATAGAEAAREDVLIERVTQIIGETLYPADVFGVMLLDEAAHALLVHPSYQVMEQKADKWETVQDHLPSEGRERIVVPVGQGITGSVAASGQPWRVRDVRRVPEYIDAGVGTCSELCVPLKVGERVIGVINTESRQRDAFSEADERLLATVAGQLATAIEKVRLYEEAQREIAERARVEEELRRHRDHLEELVQERTAALTETNAQFERANEKLAREIAEREQAEAEREQLMAAVGAQAVRQAALLRLGAQLAAALEEREVCRCVVDGLHDGLGYNFVALFLVDETTGERVHAASTGPIEPLPRLAVGQGLSERPLLDGQLHYAPDVSQEPGYISWIGGSEVDVPVCLGGEVLGVLLVESKQRDAFDQDDFEILTAAAQQAGLAIEKARLYDQAQQEIAERERAEEELRKYQEHLEELVRERTAELQTSEERYRTLFDGVPVGLYRTTPSGQILDANLAGMQMLGYPTREDLLAVSSASLYVDPEERGRWKELMDREGVVRDFETQMSKYDGTITWINNTARAVRDNGGQVLYYEGSLEEISERKQAEAELREYREHLEELVEERTAELRESEARYRTLFEGVPAGLYRTTPEGQILDANLAAVQMLGYPSREDLLAASTVNLFVDPMEAARARVSIDRGKTVRDFEMRLRKYDGTVTWMNYSARAVRDEQGQVLYYEGAMQDITERKRAEAELRKYQEHLEELVEERTAELRESEERYRTLFDGVPVGLYRTTPSGRNLDANLALVEMQGCPSREDFLAIDAASSYVNPEERVRWQALLESEGIVRDFETQMYKHDGTVIWVNDSSRAVRDEQGRVLYYEGSLEDITERKRAEMELRTYQEHLEELVEERTAELRASEERYRTLFDGVPVGLYRTTPEGDVLDVNQAFVQMAGYPDRETLLAINTAAFYLDPEDQLRWRALLKREGVVRDFETQTRRYDGSVAWISDSARAVRDEQDQVLYYEGSVEDITERKRFEEEIRRQKDYFEALFVNSPVAVVTADLGGKVVSWNPMAQTLFGYTPAEAIGKHIDELVGTDESVREEAADYTEQVLKLGRVQVSTKRTRKDGSLVDVELLALPLDLAGERVGFYAIYHDISERKKIERELRRQKEYFEALFINSPVAVVTVDLDVDVVSWNPAAEELFGYTEKEVLGRNLDSLVAHDPRLLEEARHYTERALATGRVQASTKRNRKDGSLVDVEALALPVIVGQEMVGYIAIYVNIADLQQARREAEAANQAKSTFLANMSHELRTPLNAILGFTQLMDGDPNLTREQHENLDIINRSGEHLLSLINDVLEMSKIEAGRVTLQEKTFDLYLLLDSLEEMFHLRAEEKGLMLSFRRTENLPRYLQADEGKLRQVLSNLLGNAIKFTEQGRVALRVGLGDVTAASPYPLASIRFEVEDTGPGIAPEELLVVFDPFVQATSRQKPQEGTGLGLSISRQFARLMGGELAVSSELGHGTLFTFEVQAGLADKAEAEAVRPKRQVLGLAPDQRAADGGPYRLLVVEDRETNRRLLVKLLTGLGLPPLGFEVREAVNGQEAIEIWERWEPHLIWMDMRMPVMDGHEATQRIKAMPKGQQTVIIALTATAFEEDREEILAEGCDDFVRKPYRNDEIYDVLAKHLGMRFIYEKEPVPQGAIEAAGPNIPSGVAPPVEALSALPTGWRTELQQATIKADLNQMLNLIEQIRDQQPDLADTLAHMALNFEYRVILTLIEQAGGET